MKRLAPLVVLVVLAIPVFAFQTPKPPPPTFVEEAIPDGQAVVYIYNPGGEGFVVAPSATILVFSNEGLLTLLPAKSYFTFVVDPGTVKLTFVVGAGGQYGSGLVATKVVADVAAGQEYFFGFPPFKGPQIVRAEDAKTDNGILYCKKVE